MNYLWNVSSETYDIEPNNNGVVATVKDLEAMIVRVRERLRLLKTEAEDSESGLDLGIMMGDSPMFAKAEELVRCAKTLPEVSAAKVLGYKTNNKKQIISYEMEIVFNTNEITQLTIDLGE